MKTAGSHRNQFMMSAV